MLPSLCYRQNMEQVKQRLWEDHFSEFGRGVHMFRTEKIQRLVAMGIPESLRGELWMTLSGKKKKKIVAKFTERVCSSPTGLKPLTGDVSRHLLICTLLSQQDKNSLHQ